MKKREYDHQALDTLFASRTLPVVDKIKILFLQLIFLLAMCELYCCTCWLCNCFGQNLGCIQACFCAKVWCCRPEEIKVLDDDCCQCGYSGCGGMMCCLGNLFCPPMEIIVKMERDNVQKRIDDMSRY